MAKVAIFAIIALLSGTEASSKCPLSVMCATKCPPGQYLKPSPEGCQTSCECYDPCENIECDIGGTCEFELECNGHACLPKPFCAYCEGGQQWMECGSACVTMCNNTSPVCTLQCSPGCHCPHNKRAWHHGKCIAIDDCKNNCDANQKWSDCGSVCTRTCANPEPAACKNDRCVPRCQCPDNVLWDEKANWCIPAGKCHTNNLSPRQP